MTELTRYLTLVGLLFCIGIYGLLTRRSQSAIIISLGVIVGAMVTALVIFNHTVRPSEVSGYSFALIVSLLAGMYASILYPLMTAKRDTARADLETAEDSVESETMLPPLSLRNLITDAGSFSSQIFLVVFFIITYILARISLEGMGAFVLGVVALKYILLKRIREQHLRATSKDEHETCQTTDNDSLHITTANSGK